MMVRVRYGCVISIEGRMDVDIVGWLVVTSSLEAIEPEDSFNVLLPSTRGDAV